MTQAAVNVHAFPKKSKRARKVATIEDMASLDFEPVRGLQDREKMVKFHMASLLIALGVLTKTKAELVTSWSADEQAAEYIWKMVQQLPLTEEWLMEMARLVRTAECRLMTACASVPETAA
jgi:hypothetical protein